MAPKGKYFYIKSKQSGLYLDAKGGSAAPGTPIILWSKNNGDNQVWYYHAGTKTIRSKQTHHCLDLNGDNLVVNNYQPGKADQQWGYNKGRGSVIENMARKNKVFDVKGASTAPGTEVCSWDHHGRDNQKWVFEPTGSPNRYFYIRSFLCDKVLDISGGNKRPGAQVILYQKKTGGGADNQLWFEDCYGNIRSKLNENLVLDGSSGEIKTGEFQEGKNRVYWATDASKIVNVLNPSEVLDVKGGCTDNGTAVCVWNWKPSGNQNQQWHYDFA